MFSTLEDCQDGAKDLVTEAAKRVGADTSSIGPETSLEHLSVDPLDILTDAEERFGVDLGLEKENVSRIGPSLLKTVEDIQDILMKRFLST